MAAGQSNVGARSKAVDRIDRGTCIMANLTVEQRADIQGDLGISSDQTVFTNTELDRLYTRASSNYELAVYYGYRQLLADANKLHDYTVGQTQLSRSQVRAHLRDMMDVWREAARASGNQVLIVGALEIPPRDKDTPSA